MVQCTKCKKSHSASPEACTCGGKSFVPVLREVVGENKAKPQPLYG